MKPDGSTRDLVDLQFTWDSPSRRDQAKQRKMLLPKKARMAASPEVDLKSCY